MKQSTDQVAALPLRLHKSGKLRVLMVTSRETRRWIIPKGWPMKGKSPWAAAEVEALEEAGAVGTVSPAAIGEYSYGKVMEDGSVLPCRVQVFPMAVRKLRRRWKEQDERTRRWFSAKAAAKLVEEADLARLLRSLASDPSPLPVLAQLRKAS